MTKEELRTIPKLHTQIKRKEEQLLYLSEKATAIPSIMPDPNKVQTSPSNNANKYSDAAIDLAGEIEADKARLDELKGLAKVLIANMPRTCGRERLAVKVMKYRYIKCYTWDEIADRMGYSRDRVAHIHGEALQHLQVPSAWLARHSIL